MSLAVGSDNVGVLALNTLSAAPSASADSPAPDISFLVASFVSRLKGDLTDRELQITQFLIRGFSAKEIAQTMSISPDTVRTHMRNLYPKLQVCSQARLCARFFEFIMASGAWRAGTPRLR